MRVFVSSTCYDLLDLRAELETFFQQAGVLPILSDSLSSEFQAVPDRNSIESCLANLRDCDHVVIILSNRYGPSLKAAGFEDLSATHLEYREAIKAKKPVYLYVRDRLEGDYATWRKNRDNPSLSFPWVKNPEDQKLFQLLEEHRVLQHGSERSNWCWTFRNSTELKQRVAIDFKECFSRVTALRLFETGRAPFIEMAALVRSSSREGLQIELTFRNLGATPAIHPELEIEGPSNHWRLPSLAPLETTMRPIQWVNSGFNMVLKVALTYNMIEGYKARDEGQLLIEYNSSRIPSARYEPGKRVYLGQFAQMSLTIE